MGDQPFISPDTLKAIKREFNEYPIRIIVPRFNNIPGSPVLFPAFLKDDFKTLIGDKGGREVMARHPELVEYIDFGDSRELKDIDTMEEYETEAGHRRICLIRGGGDLATGVARALYESGFLVIVTDTAHPSCIRTGVSFSCAINEGTKTVMGVTAEYIRDPEDRFRVWKESRIPVIIDEHLGNLGEIKPDILVDAIIAKRNTGTKKDMANLVICLGPGFNAPKDCHVAVETMRGKDLGKLITDGSPLPDTGTPGLVGGYTFERVIHSPSDGKIINLRSVGDLVDAGDIIAMVGEVPVKSGIEGVLRGLITNGYEVTKGLKIADVDPRLIRELAFTVSDKAEALGQAVLQAIREYY